VNGTLSTRSSLYKIIFWIHVGVAGFLTLVGPVYFGLTPIVVFDRIPDIRMYVQNAAMIGLWVMYLGVMFTLPYTHLLFKHKKLQTELKKYRASE